MNERTNERTNERATAVPCRYPGCVAESADGDACAVHRALVGAKYCDACQGTGRVQRAGDTNRYRSDPCDRCTGTGLRDAKRSTVTPKAERTNVDERGLLQIARDDA